MSKFGSVLACAATPKTGGKSSPATIAQNILAAHKAAKASRDKGKLREKGFRRFTKKG